MIKATLLILVLALALPCLADTFYIQSNGTDAADCGTNSDNACATISYLFATSGSVGSDVDDVTIKAAAGNYTAAGNSDISFTMPTTVEASSGSVTFFGSVDSTFIFSSNSSLTLEDISFSNAPIAVLFSGSDLELDTVIVSDGVAQGVSFGGETLTIKNSNFTVTSEAVYAVANATDVSISGSFFTGASQNAISGTFTGNMDSFSVSENTFQSTAGVSFSFIDSNEVEASIEDSSFTDITSPVAIKIVNGMWTLKGFDMENVNTAIALTGTNITQLSVDDIDITDFVVAITVDGGSVYVENCVFASPSAAATTGVTSSNLVELKLTGGSFSDVQTPIFLDVAEDVILQIGDDNSVITFNNTGSVTLSVSDKSNATLTNWSFMNTVGNNGALTLNGGVWGINDFVVSAANSNNNGGAFSLSGVSFALDDCIFTNNTAQNGNGGAIYLGSGALAINDCTFTGNSASEGAAVYASGVVDFSCEDTTFSNNTASGLGGGISLASTFNTSGVFAHFDGAVFEYNSASNGAAISCCTAAACNITLAYPDSEDNSDKDVSLTENMNTVADGSDVTCTISYGVEFSNAASDPDAEITDPTSGLDTWVIVVIAIILIVIILAVVLAILFAAFSYYKKRTSYTAIDDGFE